MNWKKFALAVVIAFVVLMIEGFITHGLLLAEDYRGLGPLMRSEDDQMAYFPFNLLAHVLIAAGLVWIFAQGVEDKPWLGQGIRFGLALWLLASAGPYMIYYAVQPLPGILVAKQIGFGLAETLILGIVLAAVYRKPA